jgi:hypothetical protein
LGSLSEPRRKQNLYANPKRTAKFSNNYSSDVAAGKRFKLFQKTFTGLFAIHHSSQRGQTKLLTVWLQIKIR